ncbi:MAG: hypothetical protein ACE5FL_16225, partial [Myxococcota bacterium]
MREAVPLLRKGKDAFAEAAEAISEGRIEEAPARQAQGVAALLEARELFLDIRGLIEATLADEERIVRFLAPPQGAETAGEQVAGAAAPPLEEVIPVILELDTKNKQRTARLGGLLREREAQLPPPAPAGAGEAPGGAALRGGGAGGGAARDPSEVDARRRQLALAERILENAVLEMGRVREALGGAAKSGAAPAAPGEKGRKAAWEAAEHAVERLEDLRRLFFSLIEHLRETAQLEAELADETGDAAALAPALEKIAPLAARQETLRERCGKIAEALEEQAERAPQLRAGNAA